MFIKAKVETTPMPIDNRVNESHIYTMELHSNEDE